MATLKLVIRKNKINKKGECLIFVAYGHDEKTTYFSTNEMVRPEHWVRKKSKEFQIDSSIGIPNTDANKSLLKTLREQDSSANAKIQTKLSEIKKLKTDFEFKYSRSPTIAELKYRVDTLEAAKIPKKDLLALYDEYIDSSITTRAANTIKQYRTCYNSLLAFAQQEKVILSVEMIDYQFYRKFTDFLLVKCKMVNNSAGTIIKNLKSFLTYLQKNGIEISDQVKEFKVFNERPVIIYHTEKELEKITNLKIPSDETIENLYRIDWKRKYNKHFPGKETLEKVRDLHILACSTGYRISDMKRLGDQHKGKDVLKMPAHKNKKSTVVPVTPISKKILKKYNYNLPVISDQKFNDYVKALCFLAEINESVEVPEYRGGNKKYIKYPKYELITSHVAVSTFITICGQHNISGKVVSEMTGKTVKVILNHYYGTDENFIKSEMSRAFGNV